MMLVVRKPDPKPNDTFRINSLATKLRDLTHHRTNTHFASYLKMHMDSFQK